MQSSSIKETKNTIAALVLVLREEGSVKRNECSCLFQLLMPRTLSTLWLRISAQAKMRLKYKQIRQTVVIRLRAWPEVLNVTLFYHFLPILSLLPVTFSSYTPHYGVCRALQFIKPFSLPPPCSQFYQLQSLDWSSWKWCLWKFYQSSFPFLLCQACVSVFFLWFPLLFLFIILIHGSSENFTCINVPIFCLYPDNVYMWSLSSNLEVLNHIILVQ